MTVADATSRHERLSGAARQVWFAASTMPALKNVCRSYRLTGNLDCERLQTAANEVVARHEALRTTYHADPDGQPRRVVHHDRTAGWNEHDLTGLTGQARGLRLEVIAQREFGAPFDLGDDSPVRLTVIRTGAQEHVMLVVAHRIAWDDGCWPVFLADLTRAYRDGALPPLDSPDHRMSSYDRAEDLVYWRSVMSNPPEPLELPGQNGSTVPTNWRSGYCDASLSQRTLDRIDQLASQTDSSRYAVLLAAYSALLRRYTDADDLLVAAASSGLGMATEGHIGNRGDTVVLRVRPDSRRSFRELLQQVQRQVFDGFGHRRVNLDRVIAELNPDRRHGVERLPRVGFALHDFDVGGFCPPGMRCERVALRGRVRYLPLEFTVVPSGDGAVVQVDFLLEVLDPALAEQMLRHYVNLLGSALDDPDRSLAHLELMDDAETRWLRTVSAGESARVPPSLLGDLVAGQAARSPDAVAVVHEGLHYSYRQINESANRFAHWLIGRGIGPEDRVAVLLRRSPDLIVAALGILKAGGVYLPIDPGYPADRVDFILADADPKYVVREPVTGLDAFSPVDPSDADRVRPLRPQNAAYLIYTSGSTGLPKGVPVPHAPVAEYLAWFDAQYRTDTPERLLQVASTSFDASVVEIFGILGGGGRLVIPRDDGLRDIAYLTDLLHREGITSMHFVPSLLGLFLSLPGVSQWRSLRRVPVGGEALPGELADKFHATFDALLHNFYGPTETVISASRYHVRGKHGSRTVPIGRPKVNTQIHLLDESLRPVPVGAIGEIYIGGAHVARGYHGRGGLTAERFVADPFEVGQRLYRSGDLARRNAAGDIEFVGRADEQAKIRGVRIELAEVAAAIAVDPSVGQAIVIVDDVAELGKSLIAYLTAAAGQLVDIARIRARVAAALPDYMIPAEYMVLDEIPITAHGKIDRAALPAPGSMRYRGRATVAGTR